MVKQDRGTSKADIRTIYVPNDVWTDLKVEAAQTNSTVSALVREAIALRRKDVERKAARPRRARKPSTTDTLAATG